MGDGIESLQVGRGVQGSVSGNTVSLTFKNSGTASVIVGRTDGGKEQEVSVPLPQEIRKTLTGPADTATTTTGETSCTSRYTYTPTAQLASPFANDIRANIKNILGHDYIKGVFSEDDLKKLQEWTQEKKENISNQLNLKRNEKDLLVLEDKTVPINDITKLLGYSYQVGDNLTSLDKQKIIQFAQTQFFDTSSIKLTITEAGFFIIKGKGYVVKENQFVDFLKKKNITNRCTSLFLESYLQSLPVAGLFYFVFTEIQNPNLPLQKVLFSLTEPGEDASKVPVVSLDPPQPIQPQPQSKPSVATRPSSPRS